MWTTPAPERGIEWTGERCVPWTDDVQVVYEHYHRYALAARLVRGRRVLDLACGEGYGAALLAAAGAAEVVGVDLDADTVTHARARYGSPVTSFVRGSITDPGLLAGTAPFDVVTCFEAVEHVAEHDVLMGVVERLLAPDGVLVASTPDVEVYGHGHENPFHVRELTQEQFADLLGRSFAHVLLLGQNVAVGSVISTGARAPGPGSVDALRRTDGDGWWVRPELPHTYLVGVASRRPLPELPATSLLVDPALTLVRRPGAEEDAAERARLHELYRESRDEVAALKETITALEAARAAAEESRAAADTARAAASSGQAVAEAARDAAERARAETAAGAERVRAELAAVVDDRDAAHAELADARARAERLAAELGAATAELHRARVRGERSRARLEWLAATEAAARAALADAEAELAGLRAEQSATAQQVVSRYRALVERAAPRGTRRRDAYESALGRSPAAAPPPLPPGPVAVTTSSTPVVTVVVPVHGHWEVTRRCLLAIEASRPRVPFELVVVDDCSPDASAELLEACPGVRLVRTDRNVGFVGACTLGAAVARGSSLLFLNNDTEVRPGWLDALVDTLDGDPSIGAVGAQLVSPDGTLSESGGIVWRDGTGWNVGRGADPADPEFAVVREVDYCSAAALLVRRDLFEAVGGFDERYAPAYYEDTDLAFALRATGHRVVVQPAAVVVHAEGTSHGTDTSTGVKRHQELNRAVFVEKWQGELAGHLPGPDGGALWLARQRGPVGHGGGIVLVSDHQVPTPDKDSGSVRMRALLELLVELGERVLFFPANGALLPGYTADLQQAGVTVVADPARQLEVLAEVGPHLSLVVLSRPAVAWRLLEEVRTRAPRARVAYDTVDLHFVRLGRQADVAAADGRGVEATALRARAAASRELELGLVRAADVAVVVSEVERDLLGSLVPGADVRVVSNVHRVGWEPTAPGGRSGLLFVGSFDHLPNRDAAAWLAREVLPLVRERVPDATLDLVGSHPPPEVLALDGDGVRVRGWLPALDAAYAAARVAVAPLRFGAGVKGKIGESVAAGVPTVTTPVGLEGMHLVPDEHVLVAADADGLADAAVRLLTDDALWMRLSTAGRAAVDAQFGPQVARAALEDLLDVPDGAAEPVGAPPTAAAGPVGGAPVPVD